MKCKVLFSYRYLSHYFSAVTWLEYCLKQSINQPTWISTYNIIINHTPYITWTRPMGNTTHLSKQFKSIHTYDYIITLIKRRKHQTFTLWEFTGSSFERTWIPFIQGCIVPSLIELAQWFCRRRILNVVNVFCYYIIFSP